MSTPRRRHPRRWRAVLAATLSAALGLVGAAGAHASETSSSGPTDEKVLHQVAMPGSPDGVPSWGTGRTQLFTYPASLYSLAHPGTNPRGANDFSCHPREGHNPVVLLPGTNSDAYASWSMYAPKLAALGYCVFSPNVNGLPGLPNFGYTGDIPTSARAVSAFIDRVLGATGASKVDIVGWSQGGGPLPNYYITRLGGDHKVGRLIALAPSNHGIGRPAASRWLSQVVGQAGHARAEALADSAHVAAYEQQLGSSRFMQDLYGSGPVTRPGVSYTIIEGRYDDTVAPYTNAFLHEPGVTNILVQNVCPTDMASHVNMTYDTNVYQMVVNALDPAHARRVSCVFQPFLG